MKTLKPIAPIRAVRTIGEIVLRPVPSRGQLRLWLLFARRKAKERAARKSASMTAPAESPAQARHDEPASHGHIDKRV
jgi:hypothetical protein